MNDITINSASFRDPKGKIIHFDNRILRLVAEEGAKDYEFVRDSGLYEQLIKDGFLIDYTELNKKEFNDEIFKNASYILEHPEIDFISYPYEWSFAMLQAAAVLQLDLYLKAINKGVTLSDATAYNIQFLGPKPVFIDHLSLRPYREGEYWLAHRQFCEQFLNSLLLQSLCGIPFNAWYRGNLEGITTQELNRILPFFQKIRPGIFFHVTLQSFFQDKIKKPADSQTLSTPLPLSSFNHMLCSLKKQIIRLKPRVKKSSIWSDYSKHNSYNDNEAGAKHDFIMQYIKEVKPRLIWDLGCNTGEYSITALKAGAISSIGFDSDLGALNAGYERARKENLNFLPLYMDVANPSPSQGWAEKERGGLNMRKKPDGLLALALIHHLVIGRNIPIVNATNWIIDLSPSGIIEFVPKQDPMVKTLLAFRDDIFTDYTQENFINIIDRCARILKQETITAEGRILIMYDSH